MVFFAFVTRNWSIIIMADNSDYDNSERGWDLSHLPQMGRDRGLIEALERIRNRGRGLGPSSPPTVGCGGAAARALLLKVIARNLG